VNESIVNYSNVRLISYKQYYQHISELSSEKIANMAISGGYLVKLEQIGDKNRMSNFMHC